MHAPSISFICCFCGYKVSHRLVQRFCVSRMMFGRPPAPQVNWDDMYFYQRLHHLFDHAADWFVSKVSWWMPSVGVGMILSLFVLSGPNAIGEGASVVLPTLSPLVRAPPFGLQLPEREGGPSEESEEEF
uniref:Uncharacterized protein n=1 Tax=Trypanosoma congolense (strain IL3000) TaxID=1068625 RepID=G0UXM9_TRYCI|nr:conserved hypothetical protein [Trypanosoma congolense IL3000]